MAATVAMAAVCVMAPFARAALPVRTFHDRLFQSKSRAEKKAEANQRSVTGLVTGTDDMPAVGAVVQLKDMRTMQVRSFITQTDGTYHFYELKADVDYQLSARSGDTASPVKSLSVFDSRKEAVLNLKLDAKK
jgi:hypothetical protein